MKKTLIALTLAALPVAASADVVLYGQIKGGVEVTKIKGVKGTTSGLVDYGSRIGFKGQEQLNGSLKAIWQLESKVGIDGTTNKTFGTRDSFVGLQGDFGTVKAGYFNTPVARLNGALDDWEYNSDAAGLGTFTRGTKATGRKVAVSYMTPNFNGFQAEVYASPSDNSPINDGKDNSVYGTSVSYQHDSGFFADAAGVYVKQIGHDGYQAVVQGGYDKDNIFAGLAYQRTHRVESIAKSGNEIAATGAFKVDDALRLKASLAYGFGFKDESGAKVLGNGRYYQGIVGADYALSKRTVVNGQVGYLNFGKDAIRSGTLSVGLKHKF